MYKLDHIVHFVESPEEAAEGLRSEGLHVVPGENMSSGAHIMRYVILKNLILN